MSRSVAGTTPGGAITPTEYENNEQAAPVFTTATTWAAQPTIDANMECRLGRRLDKLMDQIAGKRIVEQLLAKYGCLPSGPDGPIIAEFSPSAFAEALEQELDRCALYGWPKITIHMDAPDARLLLQYFRIRHAK